MVVNIENLVHKLGPQAEIFLDKLRLLQVLANLIQNSIKYSNEGMILIKASCINQSGKKWIMIKIKDQGVGIKDLESVGKMFSNLNIKDNVNQNGMLEVYWFWTDYI